jgi:asparagine synthetase B (glutamine-hydrolysing)
VAAFDMDYEGTVREVRRLILGSVASCPDNAALLLSGGIDSSVIAAAAHTSGKRVCAFTFRLSKLVRPQSQTESDLLCARKVASHLGIHLSEILIPASQLIGNLPMAVYLAETPRGTIVDDCTALIDVARFIAAGGFTQVWMGEAADDLFGGFKFALRYYRGAQLRAYYRRQLSFDLPNELAVIQNVFAPFGISVLHPMWTLKLLRLGYNLPLGFRLDRRRLMKQVLRDAFASDLPWEITNRTKCITRDSTQIRFPLAEEFGIQRDRYRAVFRTMMGERTQWPRKFRRQLKRLKN